MRGGKGGFGVVTSVTVDLLALAEVVGGGLYFAADDVAAVLHAYAEWAPRLPESSTTSVALLRLPSSDALPDQIRASTWFTCGSRASTPPAPPARSSATCAPRPPAARHRRRPPLRRARQHPRRPVHTYAGGQRRRAAGRPGRPDRRRCPSRGRPAADLPLSSVEIRTLGKATHLSPSRGDAVGGRATPHLLNVYAAPVPTLSDDQRLATIRDVLGAVAPRRAPVNLVNFVGRGNDSAAIVDSWTTEQNEQLDVVRDRYDPNGCSPSPDTCQTPVRRRKATRELAIRLARMP